MLFGHSDRTGCHGDNDERRKRGGGNKMEGNERGGFGDGLAVAGVNNVILAAMLAANCYVSC